MAYPERDGVMVWNVLKGSMPAWHNEVMDVACRRGNGAADSR